MIGTTNILDGGPHIVSATYKALDDTAQPFRVLTVRLAASAGNIEFGLKNETGVVESTGIFLKAEESWTFGPDCGSITPRDIFIKGTAGNNAGYFGVKV